MYIYIYIYIYAYIYIYISKAENKILLFLPMLMVNIRKMLPLTHNILMLDERIILKLT